MTQWKKYIITFGLLLIICFSYPHKTDANIEDLSDIEQRVSRATARLDTFLEMSFKHMERMKKLGMETTEARDTFTKLIYDRIEELSGRLDLALVRLEDLDKQKELSHSDNVQA